MRKNPALIVLFLTIFIDLLGLSIVIPVLPDYAKEIGASDLMVGIITASYSLMQFFFTPIWGSLSDRHGRRPVILSSILVSMVAYLIFSHSYMLWVVILSRCLSGIGSGNISAAQAYITDITPPERRAQSMGLIGAAFGLGFIFGPPIGGFVKEHLGFEYVGYIVAALCLLNVVLAYFLLPESLKEKQPHNRIRMIAVKDLLQILSVPGKREILWINFIYIAAFFMFQITAVLLWKEKYAMNVSEISLLFSFIGISTAIMQGFLIGFFTRWLGEQRLLFIGTVLLMICLATMSFVPAEYFYGMQLPILFVLAIANGMIGPASLSLLSRITGRHEQGKSLGLFQSFGSLARVFGPVLGGALYSMNMHLPYAAGALILVANLFLAGTLIRYFKALPAPSDEAPVQ